jgi:hypothetical protein
MYMGHQVYRTNNQQKKEAGLQKDSKPSQMLKEEIEIRGADDSVTGSGKKSRVLGNRRSSTASAALHNSRPVLPFLCDLHEHIAHDGSGSHESMTFALENSRLAAPHGLAEPPHIIHGNPSIS